MAHPFTVKFSIPKLARVANPFKNAVWGDDPIDERDVAAAIQENRLNPQPWDTSLTSWAPREHAERIAYLVVHPSDVPIEVDVGIPSLGCHVAWIVTDGNHRLAAAIYRKDDTILVDPAGDCRVIRRFRVK